MRFVVGEAPYFKIRGPSVWTTLALTIHADGTSKGELVSATTFPRHWLYDERGALAGKSAVIDFDEWYHHAYGSHTPWGDEDHEVTTTAAETALERRLSTIIMRHGQTPPKPHKVRSAETVFVEGEVGDDVALLLDGIVDVNVGGTSLGTLGPGSVIGERAAGAFGAEDRHVDRDDRLLDEEDLLELSGVHRREENP